MNECQTKDHDCDKNAVCINHVGSFECRCNKGFSKLDDEGPCVDDSYLEDDEGEIMMHDFPTRLFYHMYLSPPPFGRLPVFTVAKIYFS